MATINGLAGVMPLMMTFPSRPLWACSRVQVRTFETLATLLSRTGTSRSASPGFAGVHLLTVAVAHPALLAFTRRARHG